MKKKLLAVILAVLLVVTLGACGKKDETVKLEIDLHLNPRQVAKKDLGESIPKILFANEGKIAYWGSFGLYVLNGEDGSVYRSLNLPEIGYNHMTGEEVTRFLVSDDYNRLFFFNEGEDGENVADTFLYYNIEDDTLKEIPVGTVVETLPEVPTFSMEIAGGEQEGYTSNAVFYDENTTVYLQADKWTTKSLKLCKYNIETGETERIKLF